MALSRKETIKRHADNLVNGRYHATIADADFSAASRGRKAIDTVWDPKQRKFVLVYEENSK